jgi:energy-coupling factor transporter ATP-binding protein EcfA2
LIRADGLTKRFGGDVAVDGLSFTAEAGRVTGFLGPNRAGKSTTMRLILGLVRPTAGEVTVNGLHGRSANGAAQGHPMLSEASVSDPSGCLAVALAGCFAGGSDHCSDRCPRVACDAGVVDCVGKCLLCFSSIRERSPELSKRGCVESVAWHGFVVFESSSEFVGLVEDLLGGSRHGGHLR